MWLSSQIIFEPYCLESEGTRINKTKKKTGNCEFPNKMKKPCTHRDKGIISAFFRVWRLLLDVAGKINKGLNPWVFGCFPTLKYVCK